MHELSVVYDLVQTVEANLSDLTDRGPITSVLLRVGALAGLDKEALLFSYELATEGTLLQGSRLVMEEVPVVIYCSVCAAERSLPGIQQFRCPVCNGPSGDIRQGREIEIRSIEMEVPETSEAQ